MLQRRTTPTPRPTRRPAATPTPQGYQPLLTTVPPLGCEYDEFSTITTCNISNTPEIAHLSRYNIRQQTVMFQLYTGIGTRGTPLINWFIFFVGQSWIFIEDVIILYDGNRYELEVDYFGDLDTQILDSGFVLETAQLSVESLETLIDIISAEDVRYRFAGDDNFVDQTLTIDEKLIWLRALATYEELGGELPQNRTKLVGLVRRFFPPPATPMPVGTLAPAIMAGTTIVEAANLRSGPGTSYDIVGRSTQGSILSIAAVSADGTWYQLTNGAWIAASLVRVTDAPPAQPTAQP